ncbi:MAG: trypsin-like serine protease [Rivularia sp. (in: cyanobacteria)]
MKNINNKSIALFITFFISAIAFNYCLNANAQNTSSTAKTPTYKRLQDAKNFQIKGKGKAFLPKNLQQTNKPEQADDSEFRRRGVIGWDDRIPMLSRKYPWSAIGRVQGFNNDGGSYHCTGTLISDDVVLTNAHCVIDPDTRKFSQKIQFIPNVINGKAGDNSDIAEVENVVYGTDFTGTKLDNQVNDWAVLKLNKPIGLKYGYIGWKSLPSSALIANSNKYIFVGYSGDFPDNNNQKYQFFTAGKGWTAGVEKGCSIVNEDSNILFHDCDTAGGSSGGAIIGVVGNQPYILALNNAEYKRNGEAIINLAVKIDFLDRLVGN